MGKFIIFMTKHVIYYYCNCILCDVHAGIIEKGMVDVINEFEDIIRIPDEMSLLTFDLIHVW